MEIDLRQDFINMLGEEDSGWHEANLNIASEITEDFTQEDWQWLQDTVLEMPFYWQERCAEATGYGEKEKAIPVLTLLLKSESLFVSSIAATELGNMLVVLPRHFRSKVEEIMAYLREQGSTRTVEVQELLDRLNS